MGSVLYFWAFALTVVIVVAIAEYNENWTWVTIPIIGFILVTYKWSDFDIPFHLIILSVLIYTEVYMY